MAKFSGYEIQALLHHGAQSQIFRAQKLSTQQQVILKTHASEFPSTADIDRMRHEYKIGRLLDHPNIIAYSSEERANDKLLMIIEDYGASHLGAATPKGGMDLDLFISTSLQLVDGLNAIHDQGIIHKGINPSNILLNPRTLLSKFSDFSLSSQLKLEALQTVSPHRLEGALSYISPEQTGRMNRSVDYRSDFYSLGATLFYMLTGQPPFSSDDPMEMVHHHIAKRLPDLAEIRKDIPAELTEIVGKLQEKNAEDRYQSCFGIKSDLLKVQNILRREAQTFRFEVGAQDKSEQLQIPQKLYGREQEAEQLMAAYDRVSRTQQAHIITVGGYSGVGKTALIRELHKPIVGRRGYFLSGKYDQFNRDIPYSAIIQAFRGLSRELLTESVEQIEGWRQRLQQTLGVNGQVIIDVIPEVGLIIGPQPSVPELAPTESKNRFTAVFKKLIQVFADPQHPLVLFIDDLQWADRPTLSLINQVLLDADINGLLVICAYRDNEVDQHHPFIVLIRELEQAAIECSSISLQPLSEQHVTQMIAGAVDTDTATCFALAREVRKKTGGNPFFVGQFLTTLYRENLLYVDSDTGRWDWQLDVIQLKQYTENVVDFMAENILRLEERTQEVVKLASCIGNLFDLETLATVDQREPEDTFKDLWQALHMGYLQPVDDSYKALALSRDELAKESLFTQVRFSFLHDRVQQAAYTLIPAEDKQRFHLKIGRLIWKSTDDASREDKIFDIVNQLNGGIDGVTNESELVAIAQLNLQAGKKARKSAAYEPAVNYLRQGIAQLPQSPWRDQYELCYELKVLCAECEYLVGHYQKSDKIFEEILLNAQSRLDKGRVYEIKIFQYSSQNLLQEAVDVAREGLELFNVNLPAHPTVAGVLWEIAQVQFLQGKTSTNALYQLPEMVDDEKRFVMTLLSHMISSCYGTDQNLLAIVIVRGVKFSLRYGMSAPASYIFTFYAALLGSKLGWYQRAEDYAKLGLKLSERFDNVSLRSRANFAIGSFVNRWRHHSRESEAYSEKAFELADSCGDMLYAAYALYIFSEELCHLGQNLNETHQKLSLYCNYIEHTAKDQWMLQLMLPMRQYLLALQGDTHSSTDLGDSEFSEVEYIGDMNKTGEGLMNEFYPHKGILFYHAGEFPKALEFLRSAIGPMQYHFAMPIIPVHLFYWTLCLLELRSNNSPLNRASDTYRISKNIYKMSQWAKSSPQNYTHLKLILMGASAGEKGQWEAALGLLDKGVKSAQDNGYTQYEALANELAARFCLRANRLQDAQQYMLKAHYLYAFWGAKTKVDYLQRTYPELLVEVSSSAPSVVATTASTTEHLDLHSILKACQAISSEINLERLLKRLIVLIMENAGAQRGHLVLHQNQRLLIQATADSDSGTVTVLQAQALSDEYIATDLIRYVFRTGEDLVLDNASEDEQFGLGTYIQQRQPKSVLCTPMRYQKSIMGVFYLENNLVNFAFSKQRIELIQVLLSQTAISIENARLYESKNELNEALQKNNQDLEDKVLERTQLLDRARREAEQATLHKSEFLATMSHEIRTPINGILGVAELMENTSLDETQSMYLNLVQASGAALLDIINDVLDYTKIETGNMELEVISFDLRVLLEEVISIFSLHNVGKELELIFHVDDKVPAVIEADPTRIRQIIVNFVSNAFKFTTRGEIKVLLSLDPQKENNLLVQVKDTGIGIADDVQAKLFSAFSQADKSTTRKYGGTGLGLSICRSFIDLMEGDIGVESQPNVGATFWFKIPVVVKQLYQVTRELKDCRLLIAVDNLSLASVIDAHARFWGMKTDTANSQGELKDLLDMAKLSGNAYDILLLDKPSEPTSGPDLKELLGSVVRHIVLQAAISEQVEGINPLEQQQLIFKPYLPAGLHEVFTRQLRPVLNPGKSASSVNPAVTINSQLILVAEDNQTNALIIEGMLKILGHRCEFAQTGAEALARYTQQGANFDLVLMDCEMPEMDGIDATRCIREWEEEKQRTVRCNIVALTAHAAAEKHQECLAAGMNDVILKPVKMKKLSEVITFYSQKNKLYVCESDGATTE